MPLYNNILLSKKGDGKNAITNQAPSSHSNASMKLLQDHLLSKRRLQQSSASKAPKQRSQNDSKNSDNIILESVLHKENDFEPEDEYEPMMPNSYELLLAEHLKAEEQRTNQRKAELSSKRMKPDLLDVVDRLTDCEKYPTDVTKNRGAAIAPPQFLLSSSSIAGRDELDSGTNATLPKESSSASSDIKLDGGSVAAKIMSKMGYKVGQGLGRDEQGISSPLAVEKSGSNSGRILPVPPKLVESQKTNTSSDLQVATVDKMAELLRESSKVLLLQNMVGPGEVDEDLEAETKEECKKYGDVVKCLIYEIPNKRVPDEEAVRIFIEFRQVESAIKAAKDLNGRYFGGRIVKASFYSVDKFNRYELGPSQASN